jgi:hypothetical protein
MVLLKKYKNYRIEKTKDGLIEVVNPRGQRIIIALDDSKSTGERKIVKSANNLRTAKKYIDWVTRKN